MIKAFILMTFVGGTGEHLTWFKTTKEKLLKLKGIMEVYGVFGRWDIVARVEVEDMDELTNVVTDKIRSIPGIQTSETLLVIF
ncbi:Lrp/AsnC ligand binding domain-containing protein [[Eubacterium] cellulosolvens]